MKLGMKPMMLLPSMPSRISLRHGRFEMLRIRQGMCQKVMTVARGSRSRIRRGVSAK